MVSRVVSERGRAFLLRAVIFASAVRDSVRLWWMRRMNDAGRASLALINAAFSLPITADASRAPSEFYDYSDAPMDKRR